MPHSPSSRGRRLAAYRDKRDAGSTPEPFGLDGVERPGLFVVQLHAARQLHFDLRIEVDGVLKSWAVPKGPSLDPGEKRFAVATEDHPLEYADFEGIIPPGNYGAGAMIVWDRGLCVPHIDHRQGLEDGKLLFELVGYKLRGLWTLVKTKRDREWLLIKKPDAHATGDDGGDLGAESVFSGLTVDELRDGSGRAAEIRRQLEDWGAPRRRVEAPGLELMLCEHRRRPFSAAGWLFEIKYDGYRLVAVKGPEGVRFYFRSGLEATVSFPDLARAAASLPYDRLVLDGEVTVLAEDGRPDFHRLQQRGRLSRPADAERAAARMPAAYFVFDLLGFEDFDLRPLPLVRRKRLLRRLLPRAGPLRFADHVADRGEEFYQVVREMGLEGMVAKKADAPYSGGRSSHWVKVRAERVGDFVVAGYMLPDSASRIGFKALHLAELQDGKLVCVGRVGSGFSAAQLTEIHQRLEEMRCEQPACTGEIPRGDHVWVEPRLVAEVRFAEISPAGHLRFPVFVRLRDDKRPEECVREDRSREDRSREDRSREDRSREDDAGRDAAPAPPPEPAPATAPKIHFSNLEKVFWNDEGYTKGDLIEYYRGIAPWLLPYLRDRPLMLDRYPDGISGKSFYQKNAPDFTPDWIRTESIGAADGTSTLYFVADDLDTLLYLVNLGTIPLHVGASRIGSLQTPDWCSLDLDAKEATFSDAVEVARAVHRLCRDLDLDAYVKTSGATGLHVLIPLGGACTFRQARLLGELLATVVAAELPEIASTARTAAVRKGRIYVDFLQNGHGKVLVAPLSVRPLSGATVSMPLRWREVDGQLDPRDFTIASALRRLEELGEDPVRGVLAGGIRLGDSLTRLAQRLKSPKDEDFSTPEPETP